MQVYANDNPELIGTSIILFSDKCRNQFITQVLPATMAQQLSALFVLGPHVPIKEMIEVYGFWGSGSAADTLSKNNLLTVSMGEY